MRTTHFLCTNHEHYIHLVQGKTRHEEFVEDMKRRTIYVLDHKALVVIVTCMTMWALFMDDLQVG